MMTGLAQSPRVNIFNGKLLIKGHSTMLVPIERSDDDDTIIWHLLYKECGSRMSYLDDTVSHERDFSIFDLEKTRHIVGWCAEARYYAGKYSRPNNPLFSTYGSIGAADANYCVQPSRLLRADHGCALGKIILSGGRIVRGGSPFCIGIKDTPLHISRDCYVEKLKWIHKKYVMLWDEEDKRGWLVNGTSALLHLLRGSLESDSSDEFSLECLFKPEYMQEATEPHKANSAVSVLLNGQNRRLKIYSKNESYYRVEDRINELYEKLEKMLDHQATIGQGFGSEFGHRKHVEGWDFSDIATGQDPISPRVTTLQPTGEWWVDFTREISAITLLGRGFGEIIQPADSSSCINWAKLPKEQYYLAASIYDINKIMETVGDCKARPMRVTNNIVWHTPNANLTRCQCGDKGQDEHSDLVQVLLPSKLASSLPGNNLVILEKEGAVIFGQNTNFKRFRSDIGYSEEPELQLEAERPETQSHDSGMGSSVSLTSLTREHYTVGIVCALEKELLAVRMLFDSRHDELVVPSGDTNHYALGSIGQHNVVAACLPSGEYGTNAASSVLVNMRRSFTEVKFCLLVGIGGGIPSESNDIRLGDVVVSHPRDGEPGVIQYDLGKNMEGDVFKRTGFLQSPPRLIMTAISSLRSDPDIPPQPLQTYIEDIVARNSKYKYPGLTRDNLFATGSVHDPAHKTCRSCESLITREERQPEDSPTIHYGVIASGNQVIKNAETRDRLGEQYNALCVEMEAAGVMNTFPCLVIRGICDYADSHKDKTWQEYASATAAAYAKLLLSVVRCTSDSGVVLPDPESFRPRKRTGSISLTPPGERRRRRLE
ncbi:hypothetical protein ABW19_dt0209197 [Dactylella cylindrospora]|nr:hypothetical protein ABW19_dt0209197 [Dactylella cylindrospora]